MRVVFLLPMGIDRPSGRRYLNIARGLVRRGVRVRLLALHRSRYLRSASLRR